MLALVIDDSRAMRLILKRIVTKFGYEVVEAANGKEAVDYLHANETIHARCRADRLEHARDERSGVRDRRCARSRGYGR